MPQVGRDQRAPVGAVRGKSRIAQPFHELHPKPGGAPEIDAGLAQRRGESVARQGRHHHVEGIGGIAAVCAGIAEGTDHLVILPERPGPTVREDQRLGIGTLAAHVDEVDRHAVDLGAELRIGVDCAFVLAPVVAVDPVGHQLLEVGGVGAVLPAFVGEVVGPARALEARLQIAEHFIGYIDAKRFHDGRFPIHGNLSPGRGSPHSPRPPCRRDE